MKSNRLSHYRLLAIRVLTLTLCYRLISPAFAKWSFRNPKDRKGSEASSRALASHRRRRLQMASESLRLGHMCHLLCAQTTVSGGRGVARKALYATPTRRRAPLANLPNLAESRKNRKSKSTKRLKPSTAEARTGVQKTDSMVAPQRDWLVPTATPPAAAAPGAVPALPTIPTSGMPALSP